MLRLYDFLDSGNGYKVRLLLSMLGRRFELIELDILAGEGGFDLESYPAIRAWLARVAAQPGHLPITRG